MISRTGFLPIAVLFACAAFGQTAADTPTEQVLPLRFIDTPDSIQQLTDLLMVMPVIRDVSYDRARKAMVIRGTDEQAALARWLVQQLDKPAGGQAAQPGTASYEYHPPAGRDAPNTAVRVFYLTHAGMPADLHEIRLVLRSVADISRVLPFTADKAVVVRGAPERVAMAEWLVQELDQPARPGRKTARFEYHSPEGGPDALMSAVRVLYLARIGAPPDLQELQQVLRIGADIPRVSEITAQKALVIRAQPEQVALGEWFAEQLDRLAEPGRKTASYEYHSPEGGRDALASAARIFYLTHIGTSAGRQELQQVLRTGADIDRVLLVTAPKALAIRAAPERAALAEWLVEQLDQPLEPGRKMASYEYHPPDSGLSALDTATRVYYPAHVTVPEAQALAAKIRAIAGIPRTFYGSALGAMVLRGTPEEVSLAEKLIEDAEKAGAQ